MSHVCPGVVMSLAVGLALVLGSSTGTMAQTATVFINEVDADTPGADALEFVELYDGGVGHAPLDGLVLVFYNGSNDQSYDAFDLDGFATDANGYFLLGNSAVTPTPQIIFGTIPLQNGADAVALYVGNAIAFPNGTPVTTANLIDAMVYDTSDADDAGLLVLLNAGQPQVNEDSNNGANESSGRCPNGAGGARNTSRYAQGAPTPGADNDCDVLPPPVVATIMQIQGAGHTSPFLSTNVSTTGVVTAVAADGFYLQDPVGDANPATSDGIFVFTNNPPTVAVGDTVHVEGMVDEFIPGGVSSGNLSTTEITSPSIAALPPAIFPTATVIGAGGRLPPTHIIDNDAFATFDSDQDGIDFYESLEGMLVQVNDARVVGPTNDFGETWVVGDNGASGGAFTLRGGIIISPTDFNPERIQLDNTLYPLAAIWPTLDVGARFTSPVIGVVSYGFGNFVVLVTQPVSTDTSGAVTPETTSLAGSVTALTVATFNVENLAGNATAAEFAARAAQIVNHLRSPDVLVLEEIQDNDGATNSGNTEATTTFAMLIAAIGEAGGPTYQFQQINPQDGQDGGQPGGNIRIGFLYNPARVGFLAGNHGNAITGTTVTCIAGQAKLDLNPGRVDPTNIAFQNSRKPLAGAFTFNGRTLYIIGVHFASKGGDDPLFGSVQPPVLASERQRIAQAQVVNELCDHHPGLQPARQHYRLR